MNVQILMRQSDSMDMQRGDSQILVYLGILFSELRDSRKKTRFWGSSYLFGTVECGESKEVTGYLGLELRGSQMAYAYLDLSAYIW